MGGGELLNRQIESWYIQWALVDRLYQEFARAYGVPSTALFALQVLWRSPQRVTQRELCQELGLPKQTVSNLIHGLEESGRVRRQRNPEDLRCLTVSLTPEGRAFSQKFLGALRRAEEEAFLSLAPEDREAFTRVNEALTEKLREAMASRKEER